MVKNENNKPVTVRITSGKFKNKKLLVPDSARPVRERVKLAVFSILGDKIINADVLDLFAGTGNLGFESISRGANLSVFVEDNYEAVNLLLKNAENLSNELLNIKIVKYDASDFVENLGEVNKSTEGENLKTNTLSMKNRNDMEGNFANAKFPSSTSNTLANSKRKYKIYTRLGDIPRYYDIIFVDAPYNLPINHVLKNIDKLLEKDSMVVYFRDTGNKISVEDLNSNVKIFDTRTYGITSVDFIVKT